MAVCCYVLLLVLALLFCYSICACAETESIQLPFSIVVRMTGYWGVEVHSPCHPFIATGSLFLGGKSIDTQWHQNDAFNVSFRAASEDANLLRAGGLQHFLASAKYGASFLYRICGDVRANTVATPHRPGLRGMMETTELVEYSGFFFPADEEAEVLRGCQAETRDVYICAIGGDVRGFKKDHWRVKESLQYIEIAFNVSNMTADCLGDGVGAGMNQKSATQRMGKRKGKRSRMDVVTGRYGEQVGVLDQRVWSGLLVIRLARRSPQAKF